jgi:hypothetical protein
MWWEQGVMIALWFLASVSFIAALVFALLVIDPAVTLRCRDCGRWMIDTHPEHTACSRCRHTRHPHHPAARHPRGNAAAHLP